MSKIAIAGCCLLGLLPAATAATQEAGARTGAERPWAVVAKGHLGIAALEEGVEKLWLDIRLVGPGWTAPQIDTTAAVRDGQRIFEQPVQFGGAGPANSNAPMRFRMAMAKAAPDRITVHFRCTAEAAIDLVGIGPVIQPIPAIHGGRVEIVTEEGTKTQPLPLPIARVGWPGVKQVTITLPDGRKIALDFDKPGASHLDQGETRLWAISGNIDAGQTVENTVTVTLPGPVTFEPANRTPDMSNWFLLETEQDFSPGSPLGVEDWLDKPAGKHGFVQVKSDGFVCEDGTPIKFWGTNISWDDMAAPTELSDRWADKFAKYGVNLVRMHKFVNCGWAGIMDENDSLKIVEEEAALFDYMHASLSHRGIYYGWSPIFGYWLREADRDRVWAYDEIVAARTSGHFQGRTYGLVNVAPDLQDLYIKATCMMLNRVNTVTGKRYADDPALAFVELHNEDDIFFYGIGNLVAKCPTYKAYISRQFCEWLTKQYASDDELRKAWTAPGLATGESLADGTIYPFPRWWNPAELPPKRVLDSYRFLFEFQNAFYQRYVKAIRDTGYRGAIVGSCWQAADWLGHLYNIQSDRLVGFIDRHNYFRGVVPMLGAPGSALLSAGMQQVADRPFGLSEWAGNHVFGTETVPVIGIYGMGLQGWDLSAQFASSFWGIRADGAGGVNDTCDMLMNIAQYPAIARMLYRGDVREGAVVAEKRVSMRELHTGKLGFCEEFDLSGDPNLKSFSGSVPQQALGAGRVTLAFVEQPAEPALATSELGKCLDPHKRLVQATTGQLAWDYSDRGFFAVNTPGTQAVVGFCGGRAHRLSDVTIEPRGLFACIYVSADGPKETIATAKALIVTTLARTVGKGTVLDDLDMRPLARAKAEPIREEQRIEHMLKNPSLLVEPVNAQITLKTTRPFRVLALDHDGRRRADAQPVPVVRTTNGQHFTLDGAKYRTLYYLVVFAD